MQSHLPHILLSLSKNPLCLYRHLRTYLQGDFGGRHHSLLAFLLVSLIVAIRERLVAIESGHGERRGTEEAGGQSGEEKLFNISSVFIQARTEGSLISFSFVFPLFVRSRPP